MNPMNYRMISRNYWQKNVGVMSLSLFMQRKDISFHSVARTRIQSRHNRLGVVRSLTRSMFSGLVFDVGENICKEIEITPSMVKKHSLDELCVVIPSLRDYVGAYRYLPVDDIPTVITSRMAYFRCPNIITAVSLSLWLRSPDVVAAIREEFKQRRHLKEITEDLLGKLPIPEGLLQPHIVGRAMEIDAEIVETHVKLKILTDELTALSLEYA